MTMVDLPDVHPLLSDVWLQAIAAASGQTVWPAALRPAIWLGWNLAIAGALATAKKEALR